MKEDISKITYKVIDIGLVLLILTTDQSRNIENNGENLQNSKEKLFSKSIQSINQTFNQA